MDGQQTMNTTLFKTAKAGLGFNAGTGTMLEISARADGRAVRVSGYAQTLESLQLPVCGLGSGGGASGVTSNKQSTGSATVTEHGNGYVSVMLQDGILTRWELNDYLNGLNWTMSGYSVIGVDGVLHCHEMWTKMASKEKRSKPVKSAKSHANSS